MQDSVGFSKILSDQPGNLHQGMEVIFPEIHTQNSVSFIPSRHPDRTFLRIFTGGSTGKPKVWSKTPRNMLSEALYLAKKFKISDRDLFLSTVPPYHIYGLLFSVLVPFISSAQVLGDNYLYPQEIISALNEHSATILVSIPTHYRVLKVPNLKKHSLRLAFSSAGALEEADAAYFGNSTGLRIVEIYGSTETGGVAARSSPGEPRSWEPFDKVKWKIEEERLCVNSEFISPELPRDSDGYFMTGDSADYGGNSRFILGGRVDGIVKIAGNRVDLAEVQKRLQDIPGVDDAIVIAIPGQKGRGKEIAALVVTGLKESELRQHISRLCEPYAIPRHIRIVDKVPLTSTGKHDRPAIEGMFHLNNN